MPPAVIKRSRAPEMSLLVIAAGIVALVLFTGNMARLVELVFNRTALFIAVVMLVEYVIIKGFDRSAQYRRQLESSQSRRRDDLLTLQRVEQKLTALDASLDAPDAPTDAHQIRTRLHEQISDIRNDIKSRG